MTYSPSTTSRPCRSQSLALLSAGLIAALLLFSGCSLVRQVAVQSAPLEVDLPSIRPLPDPAPISVTPFKWKVLAPTGAGSVHYGLTVRGYESLAKTMADIIRWVQEAQWRLDYYRTQLTPENKKP